MSNRAEQGPEAKSCYTQAGWRRGVSRSAQQATLQCCLWVLAITFVAGGATCNTFSRRRPIPEFIPPVVFDRTPTLAEVMEHLNRSLDIQRLESHSVTITGPEIPIKLAGDLAWERNDRFSLQAYNGSRMFGKAFSAGSNSQEFWLEWDGNLFYANHDEFNNQLGPRPVIPVSPLWLREALGVVEFDPALQHTGPTMRPDGKIQIETRIPSPRGFYTRIVVLDPGTVVIEETRLVDPDLKEVAYAQLSNHTPYSAVGMNLPRTVNVQLYPDGGQTLAFTINLEFYLVNEAPSSDGSAFVRPDASGLTTWNLVQAANNQASASTSSGRVPPVYTQVRPPSGQSSLERYRTVR